MHQPALNTGTVDKPAKKEKIQTRIMSITKLNNKLMFAVCLAVAGILFGGNANIVLADTTTSGTTDTVINAEQTEDTIAAIQAKINALKAQIAARQVSQTVFVAPSAATIAQVSAKIKVIKVQADQISIKVAAFVQARQAVAVNVNISAIRATLNNISIQISAIAVKAAKLLNIQTVPAATTPTTANTVDIAQIKAQIAGIKAKIADLSEKAAQSAATGSIEVETIPAENCDANGVCQTNISASTSSDGLINVIKEEPAKKSFWQTIWDFIKKLFTF